jgi:hypothetical protein
MSGRSGSHAVPRTGQHPVGYRRGGGDLGPLPSVGPRRGRGRRCQRASGQGNAAVRGETLGDFIGPGPAGPVNVGESKVEDAIQNAVTRAEKQTAKELDVDPEDVDKALQETVKEA